MHAASPIPVIAGPPRSQRLRGGFLRRMPEKTAESNSRRALPPRAPPLLCGCFLVRNTPRGRSFSRRKAPEKPQNLIRGGPCPLEHPRCSVDVSLCGIRRAAEALSGECRRKPHDPIRGGPYPLERPRCFLVACMEWEARQKKRPPRSLNSGAGAAYFIRRGTAAGTRAGCSSLPRTAKRHRRERACPCRSR